MTTDGVIIRMDDIRRAGYCATGTRRWFEHFGLDFRDFLQNGITADDLLATQDGLAERVVSLKVGGDG